jgi:hypothetical protein
MVKFFLGCVTKIRKERERETDTEREEGGAGSWQGVCS